MSKLPRNIKPHKLIKTLKRHGFTEIGKPIHIICGKRGIWLVIITVYIPRPPKFKTPYERGDK